MNKIFEKAASFDLDQGARIKNVCLNQFGILTPRSEENTLVTSNVSICSGLALIANDNSKAALLHLYTQRHDYDFGEAAVKAHTQKSWDIFLETLKPTTAFRAVTFGGRNFKCESEMIVPENPVYQLSMRKDLFVSRWTGQSLFDCAEKSGFITDMTDLRFQDAPHDAVVDIRKGKIIVGQKKHALAPKFKSHRAVSGGNTLPYLQPYKEFLVRKPTAF